MRGKEIAGRYQIQQELGAGGMGMVYLGLDKQSGAQVAIKQLKDEIARSETLERFKREGQALRELNHPNIVKLLDALEHDSHHYLVMEYVVGGDLRQFLQRGKLDIQRCLAISIDLADALTRAHKLNIVHRDLKPANVLIAEDGTIRLTDFGVAYVIDKERVTETNAIVGTLEYLPPEIFNGGGIEPRSDIWAFGVMLFEMLAGQRPFAGKGYLQTIQAITSAPIPDLETLAPDAPTALVDLVYRTLVRDPQSRISSVRHLGAALEDILHGRDFAPLPNSRFDTPPSWNPPKHNLPAQTSPFVGREREMRQIAQYWVQPDLRLMTILAQGGMGKTRLMLEVANRLMAENDLLAEPPPFYSDGGYFVGLAPLTNPESIATAIADAIGLQIQTEGLSPKAQLLAYLRPKQMGLLLDNFEHLMEGAKLIAEILQNCPNIRITVTSRESLNIQGELVFRLQALDFPDWEKPEDALMYSSVKLFMQAAMRAMPSFVLQNDDLSAVARICKLAQGLPLAIILAASWLELLSLQEIADEMSKNIDFLESSARDVPERQRSIRAVFDYSWNLMSANEQAVFAKLSVFRGGFSREAAEIVAGANLRSLMSLVNKSLLHRDSTTGRYEIHELLRQYAEEAANIEECRAAHSQYFANSLKAMNLANSPENFPALSAVLQKDFENIRQAWLWATERGNIADLAAMRPLLYDYWYNKGIWLAGLQLFQTCWEKLREEKSGDRAKSLLLAHLAHNLGFVYFMRGLYDEAKDYIIEGIEWAKAVPDFALLSNLSRNRASSLRYIGHYDEARIWYSDSLDYAIKAESPHLQTMTLIGLANLARHEKDYKLSHELYDKAEAIANQDKVAFSLGMLKSSRCILAYLEGNYALSEALNREVLDWDRHRGDAWGIGNDLVYLGAAVLAMGRIEDAKACLSEALKLAIDVHSNLLLLKLLALAALYFEQLEAIEPSAELAVQIMQHPSFQSEIAELILPLAERLKDKLEASAPAIDLEDLAREVLRALHSDESTISL